MNKKLLSAALGTLMIMGLTACPGGYDKTVKADADHNCYVVMGPGSVGDKDTAKEDAKALAWDYSEAGKMEATSLDAISKVSKALADTLKGKGIAALYVKENVRLGETDAGWTTKALKGEEVVELNGSYAIKTGSVNYDDEDQVYSVDEWIPSPEHYTENLTPASLYMGPHSEEKDAAGNDHNANPAAIDGAGIYTVVVARYTQAVGDSMFGLGIVKTSDLEGYVAPPTYNVTKMALVGKINGTDNWDAGVELVKAEGRNTYEASVELKAGDEIKIRANDEWKYSWGAGVIAKGSGYVDNDANYAITADGTYTISITLNGTDLLVDGAKTATAVIVSKDMITKSTIPGMATIADTSVYSGAAMEFDFAGVKWTTNGKNVGRCRADYNPVLAANDCMQFKKADGWLMNTEALTAGKFKKVVIEFYTPGYDTQETKFFPAAFAGVAADQLQAGTADQTETLNGVKVGTEGEGESAKDVYVYSVSYAIPEVATFLKVGASANGAAYIKRIALL